MRTTARSAFTERGLAVADAIAAEFLCSRWRIIPARASCPRRSRKRHHLPRRYAHQEASRARRYVTAGAARARRRLASHGSPASRFDRLAGRIVGPPGPPIRHGSGTRPHGPRGRGVERDDARLRPELVRARRATRSASTSAATACAWRRCRTTDGEFKPRRRRQRGRPAPRPPRPGRAASTSSSRPSATCSRSGKFRGRQAVLGLPGGDRCSSSTCACPS